MSYGKLIPELGSHKRSHYGFVNETAVRVGAGMMMTVGVITFLGVYYAQQYTTALIVVSIFWIDFLLKVIDPRFSPIGRVAHRLVRHKPVVRVGAIQKRFARAMGLFMATLVLGMLLYRHFMPGVAVLPERGALTPPMRLCVICLSLMWLEAILGYCVGCQIFAWLVKHKFMKNSDHQNCPDNVCSL